MSWASPTTGYVPSEADDENVYLSDSPRTIKRVDREDLINRTGCTESASEFWSTPLFVSFSDYPTCPEWLTARQEAQFGPNCALYQT